MICARKAKHLDATTMFTYSHANTPLGQSERAYYLSYFINIYIYIRARFLNNVTAKIGLSNRSKKKQQKKNQKKLAVQPLLFFFLFLSFSSLTLFSLSLFFSRGFSGSFCLRLLVFFLSQKTAIFVRYVLKNPAR